MGSCWPWRVRTAPGSCSCRRSFATRWRTRSPAVWRWLPSSGCAPRSLGGRRPRPRCCRSLTRSPPWPAVPGRPMSACIAGCACSGEPHHGSRLTLGLGGGAALGPALSDVGAAAGGGGALQESVEVAGNGALEAAGAGQSLGHSTTALLGPTEAHSLDDPPDLSCKNSTRQYAVDGSRLSCKQQVGVRVPPPAPENLGFTLSASSPVQSSGASPVASGLRCKRATGVGSLEELTTHEGDLHPWQHEQRPPRPSVLRSMSCSPLAGSC